MSNIRLSTGAFLFISTAFFSYEAQASSFTTGDVFVAIGNGQVKEFTPSGTLVQTLNDGSGATYTTGMAFDGSGNLYVTNFGHTVSKFNANGTLAATPFLNSANTAESILVNKAGDFLVAGPGAPIVEKFSAAGGSPTTTYNVTGGNGTGGTDWADLSADQHTLYYDGEGTVIKRYDLATHTQLADFGTAPNASVFAFRIIPTGTFIDNIVAADSSQAIMFNSTGTVIKQYVLPGNGGGDFALNLDPNGTDFWTADFNTGRVWEVNIATGAIDSTFLSGNPNTTFGLVVAGELTAGGPPPSDTPEPATFGFIGTGLLGLGLWRKKRNA